MNEDTIKIGQRIKSIVSKGYTLIDEAVPERGSKKLKFESGVSFGALENVVQITIDYKLLNLNREKEAEQLFLVGEVEVEYGINPDDFQKLIKDNGDICLPRPYALSLAASVYNVARGYILAKTENTKAYGLNLPLIDVTNSISADVIIEKDRS